MKLINKTKWGYVDAFIETFGSQLNSYNGTKKYTIGEKSQGNISYIIDLDHTPFGCNPISNCIGINEDLCQQIGLSDEEKHAMLLHEVGHLVMESPQLDTIIAAEESIYWSDFSYLKELSADSFPVSFNKKAEVISGLGKMILSNINKVQSPEMERRSEYWKKHSGILTFQTGILYDYLQEDFQKLKSQHNIVLEENEVLIEKMKMNLVIRNNGSDKYFINPSDEKAKEVHISQCDDVKNLSLIDGGIIKNVTSKKFEEENSRIREAMVNKNKYNESRPYVGNK